MVNFAIMGELFFKRFIKIVIGPMIPLRWKLACERFICDEHLGEEGKDAKPGGAEIELCCSHYETSVDPKRTPSAIVLNGDIDKDVQSQVVRCPGEAIMAKGGVALLCR